jgi:hypothetical protein
MFAPIPADGNSVGPFDAESVRTRIFVSGVACLVAAANAAPVSASSALSYSTYLGGSGLDIATGVAVDDSGNLYVTGYTNSPDLPVKNAAQPAPGGGTCGRDNTYPCFDAFVLKLDPAGQKVIYATYFGGSGEDCATGIAIDSEGNAYITGYTNSPDLPVINAFQGRPGGGSCGNAACLDAFVMKLNAAGSQIVYSTYLGGSSDDAAQGIAVDAAGNAVVTGFTASADFPARAAMFGSWAGGYDAFVSKLSSSGDLLFSTFLGGAGNDFGTAVATDAAGNIWTAGSTNSADLPSVSAVQNAYASGTCGALTSTYACFDAYVARLAADGARFDYLTYLGGSGGDYAYGLAVDATGSAYATGMTTSQDFLVTFHAFQTSGGGNNTDAFITRLDPSGASMVHSTYLGGFGPELANSVAVDAVGRAFVAGYTYGSDLPLTNPTQSITGGFYDAFLAVLDDAGTALEFSTYLGGTGNDKGRAVAVDRFGNAYVAGETFSSDFPVVRALQPGYAGGSFDAFITKVALGDGPALHLSNDSIDFGAERVGTSSVPHWLTVTNIGGDELAFESVQATGDFLVSNDCFPLAPGTSCELALRFSPSAAGERTGGLTISHNGAEQVSGVLLRGVGLAPEISLSASSVSFGHQLVGTESAPQEVKLTNSGTASLELSGISVSGEFMQSNDCPAIVAVEQSCTISLMFTPTAAGERAGGLAVTNRFPEETRTASLFGIGTDFSLSASPGAAAVVAGESASFTLTVTPAGGFQGTVSLACSGAPKASSCSISPASAIVDSSSLVEVKVTVNTTAKARSLPLPETRVWVDSVRHIAALPWLLAILLMAWKIRAVRDSLRVAKPHSAIGLACILLLAILWMACGGGSSEPPPRPGGTPPGIYTLTLTGTYDGVSRSTGIELRVN